MGSLKHFCRFIPTIRFPRVLMFKKYDEHCPRHYGKDIAHHIKLFYYSLILLRNPWSSEIYESKKSLKGGISNAVSIIYYTKARTIDLRKIVVGYILWAFDLTTPLCSEGYLFQRTWSSKAVIVKTIFTCDVVLV